MIQDINCIFLESRCLYGSPKVTSILRQKGKRISKKTTTHCSVVEKKLTLCILTGITITLYFLIL
ncbi:hypothetical protein [Bacillus cereus]